VDILICRIVGFDWQQARVYFRQCGEAIDRSTTNVNWQSSALAEMARLLRWPGAEPGLGPVTPGVVMAAVSQWRHS
jgi:hypothetical protein